MRIAFIGQKGIPAIHGGVEKHVHDLAVRLSAEKHDVVVYARKWYTGKHIEEYKGVKVQHTPNIHTKHLDTITHTLSATLHAVTQKYDVIHYHGIGPSLLSWIPRLFARNTKVITTFHSIDRHHQKWNWFAKFVLRLAERAACTFAHETITISQGLRQYCMNEYGKQTTYIPNGVEIPEIKKIDEKIKSFGLVKDNYLVMISRLVPHKGAHILIEAFHRLKAHNPDNEKIANLKLAIVGGAVYTDEYVRQLHIQASGVNDILFTDFQSGEILKQLFANAKALIHPSLNEGLPINVLEAMSFGLPVLVSNIPEHIELIQDYKALFKENDVESLEQTLYNFLNLNEKEQADMGEKNKQVIKDGYSWDRLVPQIVEIYEDESWRQAKDKKLATAPSVIMK